MPYSPFYDVFPELAVSETRTLLVLNDPFLPPDQYVLTELFCDEVGCDCRRVFFHIYAHNKKEFVAVIAFGWEPVHFYKKWLNDDDPRVLKDLKGPVLNLGSDQSEIAPILLERIKEVVKDKEYIERLKRHYRIFKDHIAKTNRKEPTNEYSKTARVGRNQPCPCGSGKKYKFCCGN
jgi:hypothetical protein